MWGRFRRRKTRRGVRAYARVLGVGIVALATGILIPLLLRLPRRTERESEAAEEGRVAQLKSAARRLISRERQRADAAEQEANELRDELEEEHKPWWQRFFDKVKKIRS